MNKKLKNKKSTKSGKKVELSEIQIEKIKNSLSSTIEELEKVNEIFNDSLGINKSIITQKIKKLKSAVDENANIIEGIFDGEKMITKNKNYTVPANYASKSKLVAGDKLKLTITPDGTFIYKQIGPIKRKRLTGKLVKKDSNFYVKATGNKYKVLPASVTYFKINPEDSVIILIPEGKTSDWATIENINPNKL